MLVTTQDEFKEYEIVRTLGIVRGNTVRAKWFGQDFIASLRTIVGGEIPEYTKMLAEAREQSLDRMKTQASAMGGNAIVAARFSTSAIMQGAAEMMAFGTAVVIVAKETPAPADSAES